MCYTAHTKSSPCECCLEIQKELTKVKLGGSMELSIKLGVGVGQTMVLHVGGVHN